LVRVLIVEDSRTQAAEIRFRLEDAGVDAEVAADGVEALAALDREGFDVVVADLRMPRMDGLELVEAVRRDHPAIPVVLVTAHGSEEVAARALRAGAAGYVPEANLGRDLAATLSDVLALRGSDPGLARVIACMEKACLRFTLGNDPALVPPLVGRIDDLVAAMGLCDRRGSLRVAESIARPWSTRWTTATWSWTRRSGRPTSGPIAWPATSAAGGPLIASSASTSRRG